MCNLKDFSTDDLINELSHRRDGIRYISTMPVTNKIEIVIEDCNRNYTNRMPDGTTYLSNIVFDEFHYNGRGIIIIGGHTEN